MDTFYPKCTRGYDIQVASCLECHIPKYRSFNLVPAALDSVSMAHVIFKPIVKSLASLCGHARCIYLCILLNIMYSADCKTEYLR